MLEFIGYDRKNQVVTYRVLKQITDASRFVIQDQTFDRKGKVSDRQPHQYTFPSISYTLEPGELVKVHLTKPSNSDTPYTLYKDDNNTFVYELFAGFAKNAINRNGDTVTLLYKVDSVDLPSTP